MEHDLDDSELRATRKLHGLDKESNIEEDIKRCEELIKPEHANWIGISNQLAIAHVLNRIKNLELAMQIKEKLNKLNLYEKNTIVILEKVLKILSRKELKDE